MLVMRKQLYIKGEVVMKNQKVTIYFIAFAFLLMIINITSANATERKINWDILSENLVNALQSDNPGLQQSAMRLIIQYANHVHVDAAVFNLMRLYRQSEDCKVRQLALVTLHKIGNAYAMDFVKRNIKFETDVKMIKLSNAIINSYNGLASVEGSVEIVAR
jgi:hypothetical protein